ncbi:MAG: type II toxin-antitoxin system Phd/YefM family antitoxin [Candidatus Binatia bacterium]
MSAVGIKELKNSLTRYLRRCKQGEEVIVTDRGTPIALIQPIKAAKAPVSLEAKLAKAAAQGLVALPTRKISGRVRVIKAKGKAVSKIILEDRR